MKKQIYTTTMFTVLLVIAFAFRLAAADITAKSGTFDWSTPTAWDLNRVPQCGDKITIPKNSVITVTGMLNFTNGTACDKTQLNISGKLMFTGGKKIRFAADVKINLRSGGEIHPSKAGGGTSESIERGTLVFWKSADGILLGKPDVNDLFAAELAKATQKFTLADARSGGTVTGTKGTRVIIRPGSLTNMNGAQIEGAVDIELIEFYKRSDMILVDKPTMGVISAGNLAPLLSGGEYFLRITQNAQEVIAKDGVEIRMKADVVVDDMEVFEGSMDEDNQLSWTSLKEKPAIVKETYDGESKPAYAFIDRSWGWTNIDKFITDPREKTKVLVKLPSGYDFSNTSVFVTFDGQQNTLAKLDEFTAEGYFTEHYGYLPIGLQIHVIALSRSTDGWVYTTKGITVSENMSIEMGSLVPVTQNNLLNYLIGLP